ncbi:MAG: efflux RND transporter periplasmic adaptor subunit [Spirochaetota bacterium]|nr:efflux RND transporter periplasmic adaptor subunit [Spirochaetota bacterium]
MYKIKSKNIIVIAIILCSIGLIFFLIRGCSRGVNYEYIYEKAARGEVKKTISVTGRLEVLDSHIVLSKISGIVKKVYLDFNQKVKKNQLLATLDSTEIDQKITKVESLLDRDALDLLAAKRDLEGKRDLFKDNLISKREMEMAELKYKKITSQLKQTRIDYEIILKKKSYTRITSPCNGIVISREINSNNPVSLNKVLFVIAEDLKRMRLIIQVDESDIGYIKKGQSVIFSVSAFPEKVFQGKISQVRLNPIITGQIVSYQSLVTCDNNELLLKPGMTATATVVVSTKKDVLRLPNEAFIVSPIEIQSETGKRYVWRKQNFSIGELPVVRIEVKIGLFGDYFTEVLADDISVGDEILVGIHKKLDTSEDMDLFHGKKNY